MKTPKLYFTDTGLACALLGIETIEQLERDPLRGHLIENLGFLELLKARTNRGLDPRLSFFRDAHGHEVDFLFQSGHNLIPMEVKASQTFHSDFLKGLQFFKEMVGERCPRGFLVYAGTQQHSVGPWQLLNFKDAATIVTAD